MIEKIEVICVAEPEHYKVLDMYIPPESCGLVAEALGCAATGLEEWDELAIRDGRPPEEDPGPNLNRRIMTYDLVASRLEEILGESGDGQPYKVHVPEAQLVYEGMMYGLGRMADIMSRKNNVLDILLWAMDFTVDSLPRRRIGAQKRAELLDEYLGRISYIIRTPDEYRAARI